MYMAHAGISLRKYHAKMTLVWNKGDYKCKAREKGREEKQFSFWLSQDATHKQRL